MNVYFAKNPKSWPGCCAPLQTNNPLDQEIEELINLINGRKILFCIGNKDADSIFRNAMLCQALEEQGLTVQVWIDSPLSKVNSKFNGEFSILLEKFGLSKLVYFFPNLPPWLDKDVIVIHHGLEDNDSEKILLEWAKKGTECRHGGGLWS
jgi:hypothetical protein